MVFRSLNIIVFSIESYFNSLCSGSFSIYFLQFFVLLASGNSKEQSNFQEIEDKLPYLQSLCIILNFVSKFTREEKLIDAFDACSWDFLCLHPLHSVVLLRQLQN